MSEVAERLYERALALEPEAQTRFVEEACRGDPRLREELVSLLEQAEAADEFFDLLTDAVLSVPFSSGGGQDGDASSGGVAPELSPQSLHLDVGHTVGQYRILSRIGSGGMGTVYRAHDTRLDRDVALKFLPSHLSKQRDAEEDRLLVEARAAAALEHPNVCSIHEIGETEDGQRFIAMAVYEGETLKERLGRGPLPLEEAVATAVQIARGLAAAHARGIIHRDVKPGNVILGADGTVRLLDFGLAQAMEGTLTRSGMTPGTVAYMSPEQARGDRLDQRTDLWSLGVVLYEMLAGARPFRGADHRALLHAILHEDAEPLSKRADVPGPFARVVERLLQKDPSIRYQSASELLADLTQAVPSRPGPSRLGIVTRRRGALLAGSFTALVALVGAVLWFTWRGEESAPAVASAAAREPSIAVLPLANLSADPHDAALADGMTEELIATLARAGDLRVIGRTSAFAFKDREMDIRSIADSLGVSNILEGGFQKIGSRFRVQIRLVDARNGSTRWSQTYDREFRDLFSVQDEIARAVAGELVLRFDRDRQLLRHPTRNVAAYELYLRGVDPLLLRSDSGVREAVGYLQQAIAVDSTYAAAHAALAIMYRRLGATSDPGMPLPKLHALAEEEARKAIALDDSLAEAHYALGRIRLAQFDFASAETEIKRAVALDPSRSIYRRRLLEVHSWAGRYAEELAEARRILETDPLDPYARADVAGALYTNGRYDEALAELDRIVAIQPPLQAVPFIAAQCYARKQMWPEAIAALRPHAEAGDRFFLALLGYMLARTGQREEANRILGDLLDRQERTGVGAFQVAMVHAGLGDFDQAFVWLDRSVDDRSMSPMLMGLPFEDMQSDPRFERLRNRLGLQKL